MHLLFGSAVGKRCLRTFQPSPIEKSSHWTNHSANLLSKRTVAISYYITAVAALSTLIRTTTTTGTTALFLETQPTTRLLYRPVFVRRVTAATNWVGTTKTTRTTTVATSITSTAATRNMSSSPTIIRDNGTITVSPKIETDQSALIVIAHGLGDSAEGFVDVAEHLAKQMPYAKFILPTAPSNPVTMNMGMSMPSWYDITGLDERSNENCNGLERSVTTITNILDNEHMTTGLPYQRMILAGFSQGGALSLFTGFQLPYKIAGIVCMSGYLPASKKFRIHPGNEDIPVLHCHGTQDMLVAYPLAQKSKVKTQEMGCTNYTIQSYPVAHTVDTKEIADVLRFLKERLPPDETCKIKVKDANEMTVKELRDAIKKAGLSQKAVGLMEKSEFVRLLQDYRDGKL